MKWRKSDYSVRPNWATMLPGGLTLVVSMDGAGDADLALMDWQDSVIIATGRIQTKRVRDAQAWAEATASIVFRALGNHFKEPRP